MKQFLCVLMLATGMSPVAFAQQKNTQETPKKTFELPGNYITTRFYFDLGHGNQLQLGLKIREDLDQIGNIDSLIHLFLLDLTPFIDSPVRRTDQQEDRLYYPDAGDRKELRIRQYTPQGSSYLLQQGVVSTLKLQQDTIHILAPVGPASANKWEILVIINEISQLPVLLNTGINDKIIFLRKNIHSTWTSNNKDRLTLDKAPDISEVLPGGATSPKQRPA